MDNGTKVVRPTAVYKAIRDLGYRVSDAYVLELAQMLDRENKKKIQEICEKTFEFVKHREGKNLKLRDLESLILLEAKN